MILHFYDIGFDINDLFKKAVEIDNYDPNIGWKHQTICDVAAIYGPQSHRTENETVDKLIESLEKNEPLIVSIHKHFDPQNGGHLVVLNGYFMASGELLGFYVNDPVGVPYKNKDQFIEIDKFMKGWKKRAIYFKNCQ